ncbi:MAG: alpha-ketoacid dehydrogenase subunit beta [Myxococcales bacterium]|nr:alpha-ketoacid dehydrogenase subunit beta [Myxococcales bacterium]
MAEVSAGRTGSSAAPRAVAEEKRLNMVQALNEALADEMARDETVLVMGEDVGPDGGVFRVTEGLIERFGNKRVLDTPLAESGIVGSAIGLCVGGFRPVCEIQFMGFIYPCLNQLCSHAARLRNRSRGTFAVPMVVRMPYGGGIRPPEHHSESYEAMLANTPGLKVVIPSDPYEAKGLLIASIRDDDPVVFLEPKRIYRAFRQAVPTAPYEIPLGEARVAREGSDVTVIAYGAMLQVALASAKKAEAEGISVEVVDLRCIVPLDVQTFVDSVVKTGRAVVLHEGPRTCGVGAEVAAAIGENALLSLLAPVERVTGFDTVFPGALLETHYLPHEERVLAAIRRTIDY